MDRLKEKEDWWVGSSKSLPGLEDTALMVSLIGMMRRNKIKPVVVFDERGPREWKAPAVRPLPWTALIVGGLPTR
jgi:hypothetical protein